MRKRSRSDANQSQIVKALEKIGAAITDVHCLGEAGFDILVAYRGQLFIMEIKDGEKPPSQRKLTENEKKAKRRFELNGVKYHIIKSVEEAIATVNNTKPGIPPGRFSRGDSPGAIATVNNTKPGIS